MQVENIIQQQTSAHRNITIMGECLNQKSKCVPLIKKKISVDTCILRKISHEIA